MSESFTKANNIKICYKVQGEGFPVILIHGYGSKKETWIAQTEPLSKKFKVITMDNRGAGKSDRPNYPYTMDMYVEDIRGLMENLNINKAHLIGWSLGGMITQNFVLKYPDRVNKLVLINTFPGFPNEQGLIMYKKGLITTYEGLLKDPVKAFFDSAHGYTRKFKKTMEENINKKFFGLWSAKDMIEVKSINPFTPQDIENSANAIAGHNVINRLKEVKNKTLVLGADKDKISPQIVLEKIHENLPNSILKVIKDAGHDSPLEKAPEVNQILIDFLKD
jgi:pimeloyl-ACP methyl ester carboxylesterase